MVEAAEGFGLLGSRRDRIIPVVGAGLVISAGPPSSDHLADELAARASEAGVPGLSGGLYEVANQAEATLGPGWVQKTVADLVRNEELVPTSALRALTLTPTRVIATTNYDFAIEAAAELNGIPCITATPRQLGSFHRDGVPEATLLVVHVHGHVDDPTTIVLTKSSYEKVLEDDAVEQAVRTFAASRTLVFLGHRLSDVEEHMRRDLAAVTRLFGSGAHLLFASERSMSAIEAQGIEQATGVTVVRCPDPEGDHRYAAQAISALVPRAPQATDRLLPRTQPELDLINVPMLAAPAEEATDETSRYVWRMGQHFGRELTTVPDLTGRRILLIGAPGTGKTHALRHEAKDDPDPSVYMHLSHVPRRLPGVDLGPLLVSWVAKGSSEHDGTRVPTPEELETGRWSFYVDGLDELEGDERSTALSTVTVLADSFPQHRWVVGSRKVTQLTGALPGFERFELIDDVEWSRRYAAIKGVEPATFDAYVDAAPGIESIIAIPLFAAATVNRILEGLSPPGSALELVLDLAAEGLRQEHDVLQVDKGKVDGWLDRLALAMTFASLSEVAADQIMSDHLRGQIDAAVSVDWLVTRVLLTEETGRVSFVRRPFQDSRAARALADHPRGTAMWLLGAVAKASAEMSLRPTWQYITFLLLGADYDLWTPVISPTDPVAAARQVPTSAPEAARAAALETIWSWYEEHRILLPRQYEGEILNDDDEFARIARGSIPSPLLDRIVDALTSDDFTFRANAIAVLSAAGHGDIVKASAEELIQDSNSVVRRRLIYAAEALNWSSLATVFASASAVDSDNLARQAAAEAAIRLARDDELATVLSTIPTRTLEHVGLSLRRRMGRRGLLDHWKQAGGADLELLDDLAGDHVEPWTADEIEALGELWYPTDDPWGHSDIRTTLAKNPAAALKGALLTSPPTRAIVDLQFLLFELDDAELRDIAAGRPAQTGFIERFIEERRARAAKPPPPPPAPPKPDPRQRLHDAAHAGDLDVIAEFAVSGLSALTDDERRTLTPLVEVALTAEFNGERTAERITRSGERQWAASRADWNLLLIAAELQVPVDVRTWVGVAKIGYFAHHKWLKATFDPSYLPEVATLVTEADAELLGWLGEVIPTIDRATAEAGARALESEDSEARANWARLAAGAGATDLLRAAAASHPSAELDEALVEFGDDDAEARLISRFTASGCQQRPGFPLGWVDNLRGSVNEPLVFSAVQHQLRDGVEAHDLMSWFRALNRLGGPNAPARYDELIGDTSIGAAPFLLYRKVEATLQVAAEPARDLHTAAALLFGTDSL